MEFRVISIGALSHHELWQESGSVRTPHATTTLVRSGDRVILVDPALPGPVISARLRERAGIDPQQVTDVFLTCFRPAHRMGLEAFGHSHWLIHETERESIGAMLISQLEQTADSQEAEMLRQEIQTLSRFKAAPDQLADQVDLFPCPGYTPGCCGLLLTPSRLTVLIAGDAVASIEHLEHGRVLRHAYDTDQARESLAEAIEIADLIVPGHDNVVLNPTRRPF